MMKDRDERVRAAVVIAIARLEPGKAATDLAPLARDKSPAVLASLAEAWVTAGAFDKTAALLDHEAAPLRLAAATALAAGPDAARAKLTARTDLDPALRVIGLAVTTDRAALEAASTDPDAGVRAAAASRMIVLRGRAETLADVTAAVAAAPAASAERVRTAAAWLNAH